ncbi:hypothetical protein F4810DRAFT_719322 [Camillea tinctor]|nr:hypothetical protein F4810DRAFT_719322 [Camillea tinctor]
MASSSPRPLILIVSHSLMGHIAPMLRISSWLASRGWTVYFLGPTAHRARIASTGATFIALQGPCNIDDQAYWARPPVADYASQPWYERVLIDLREQVLCPLPSAWASVCAALRLMRHGDPSREVIILAEAFFYGVLPLRCGAPLDAPGPRPRSLCVSVTVPALRSGAEAPPLGYGHKHSLSAAAARERNERLWAAWARKAAPLTELLEEKLREAGAARGLGPGHVFLSGENYVCHERILQLGVPGLEYPRGAWPAGFRFVGLVQGEKRKEDSDAEGNEKGKEQHTPDFPWWPTILSNSASLARANPQRKKILLVAQGTVETNPQDLIVPTIRAFAGDEGYIVLAILGWKNARLTSLSASSTSPSPTPSTTSSSSTPPNTADDALPPNAFIAPYLSYDAALPHADIWIHNGGFGAVSHGIAHGVPMVVAGEGMDKGENAERVAWSGIGVDLKCGARASAGAVREGVEWVLRDDDGSEEDRDKEERREKTPRQRVRELQRENEALDCFRIVEEELWGLASVGKPESDEVMRN